MDYEDIFSDEEKDGEGAENTYDYDRWQQERFNARKDFIASLSLNSPREISERVKSLGYKGQELQCRAMALMAYRHIRRLKRIYSEGIPRHLLPPKQNMLLSGPTGCGKTFLIELLFREVLKLPTVIVDITSFTESGYVGDDVKTILTRLVNAAEENAYLAECGVVCLDEFDKLAASSSNARFSGEGTTKDVSGYGVQRELLTMIHGAEIAVPMDYGYSQFGTRLTLATHDLPFIACGAFSGIEEAFKSDYSKIGFRSAAVMAEENIATVKVVEEVEAFQRYGFLPELIGRFTRIVSFPALTQETLKRILYENILPQYFREFEGEGLQLSISETALDHVVNKSLKRKTGARGLHSELAAAIEQAAFETFGEVDGKQVVVTEVQGKLSSQIS